MISDVLIFALYRRLHCRLNDLILEGEWKTVHSWQPIHPYNTLKQLRLGNQTRASLCIQKSKEMLGSIATGSEYNMNSPTPWRIYRRQEMLGSTWERKVKKNTSINYHDRPKSVRIRRRMREWAEQPVPRRSQQAEKNLAFCSLSTWPRPRRSGSVRSTASRDGGSLRERVEGAHWIHIAALQSLVQKMNKRHEYLHSRHFSVRLQKAVQNPTNVKTMNYLFFLFLLPEDGY